MHKLHATIHRLSRLLGIPGTQSSLFPHTHVDVSVEEFDCVLIKGDNLEALSLLTQKIAQKVDFCYIDPPYNTGSKFVYDDSRYTTDSGIWGRHAAWMGFMLPRLVYMRELLQDTGIVAISIDDYEYAQLKILMDNIFGADNHFGTLIVNRSKNGKGSKAHIAVSHEHVLIYGKTNNAKIIGLPELDVESYNKQDAHGRYKIDGLFRKKGAASKRIDRPNMFYPLYYDDIGNVFTEDPAGKLRKSLPLDSKGEEKRWLWGCDKAHAESWRLYASSQGVIYVKNYLTDEKRIKVRSIWDDPRYLTERATNEITEIYGEKVFETPKPLGLIEDLIKCCAPKNALILDFFCGTATTAHAAYNVNKEDGGKRQVILVEQKVKVAKEHIAASLGFQDISAIAEFRLIKLSENDPAYRFKSLSL
ncbi:MAG: site-specific DNA-methyltransferase [Gallionellaceae bacterium]|jgi:adenine-specific DNA-methyltransferase